jgi:hypothetical protein
MHRADRLSAPCEYTLHTFCQVLLQHTHQQGKHSKAVRCSAVHASKHRSQTGEAASVCIVLLWNHSTVAQYSPISPCIECSIAVALAGSAPLTNVLPHVRSCTSWQCYLSLCRCTWRPAVCFPQAASQYAMLLSS